MWLGEKTVEIKFYPKNEIVRQVIPAPKPVRVPNWFKDIPNYNDNAQSLILQNGETNYTVKSCVPFLDTFSTGYVFELWCDIQLVYFDGQPFFRWLTNGKTSDDLFPVIDRPNANLPINDGYLPFTFSWVTHWGIQTPRGYSCLFTHPLNRTDLPFITTSGVMDTDGWGIWGNQPFALKRGWEGIIEAGTPIIQFIPFKREKWNSVLVDDPKIWQEAEFENTRRTSKIRGYYKNKYWNRKEYK